MRKTIPLTSLSRQKNTMSAIPVTATQETRPWPLPTIAQVSSFVQAICPSRTGDVNFAFHSPRTRVRNPDPEAQPSFTFIDPHQNRSVVSHVVLSITPTPGFYHAFNTHSMSHQSTPHNTNHAKKPSKQAPIAFLHRPWTLDRRSVPRNATVLACHKGFDEYLTVGNNIALGRRLGMVVEQCTVIQGYKGDPERTIGLVGRVSGADGSGVAKEEILSVLQGQFGAFEGTFGFGRDVDDSDARTAGDSEGSDVERDRQDGGVLLKEAGQGNEIHAPRRVEEGTKIQVIAIMNAFHPAEVEQVEAIARDLSLELGVADAPVLKERNRCDDVLYLTGAIREPDLLAAREKGMAVVCVGHRICEEWGIRYMAELLRQQWPGLRVDEILEDEMLGKEETTKKLMVQTQEGKAVAVASGPRDPDYLPKGPAKVYSS